MSTDDRYEHIENIWDDDVTDMVMQVDVHDGHVGVYVHVDDGIYLAKLNKRQTRSLTLALQRAVKRLP